MPKKLMKNIISAEYLFAAMLVVLFFVAVGQFDWWWLVVFFLVFDISAIGYLANPRLGAFAYNLGHSLIGPTLLTAIFIATNSETVLFVTLLWLFHIFVDRALGFGLKYTTSFHHTHLGEISKAKN